MTDYGYYQELFAKRLDLLVWALGDLEIPKAPPFAPLIYLRDLLVEYEGHFRDLEVQIEKTVQGAGGGSVRMSYDLSSAPRTLRLDHRLMDAFDKVVSRYPNVQPGVVDCFLIHEFLHYAQGMGHGRHSGLSSQSPNTLLAIDYQADAMAAVSLAILAVLRPENYDRDSNADNDGMWTIYHHAIQLALGQMEVFTHLASRELDREAVSNRPFPLDKLQRTVIWQYQYHRAKNFSTDRSWADFQILSQPHFHFRNLEGAWANDRKFVSKEWPDNGVQASLPATFGRNSGYEKRPESDPFCILAAPSPYGTTRFVRIPTSEQVNKSLFEALFDGDVDGSQPFFQELFRHEPWLIGQFGDDEGGPGGGGPGPDPLPNGPGGSIQDLGDAERLEYLMTYLVPTAFPLVVMGVEGVPAG